MGTSQLLSSVKKSTSQLPSRLWPIRAAYWAIIITSKKEDTWMTVHSRGRVKFGTMRMMEMQQSRSRNWLTIKENKLKSNCIWILVMINRCLTLTHTHRQRAPTGLLNTGHINWEHRESHPKRCRRLRDCTRTTTWIHDRLPFSREACVYHSMCPFC